MRGQTVNALKPVQLSGGSGFAETIRLIIEDTRLIATDSNSGVKLWNLISPDVAASAISMSGHHSYVQAIGWNAKESVALTWANDTNLGIWKIDVGELGDHRMVPMQRTASKIAVDENGGFIAAVLKPEDPIDGTSDAVAYRWSEVDNAFEKWGFIANSNRCPKGRRRGD